LMKIRYFVVKYLYEYKKDGKLLEMICV